MKFYVEKCLSKKGNPFICLKADLGYRTVFVTLDSNVIAILANLAPSDIFDMEVGEIIELK